MIKYKGLDKVTSKVEIRTGSKSQLRLQSVQAPNAIRLRNVLLKLPQ